MKPVRVYFLCSLLAHIRAETVKVGVRVARLWHDSCTKLGGEWVYLSGYQGENISPKFKPFCMWHEWFFSNYSWWAQEGFFFPNLHFQLVYRNLIANELCKLGCTYMVRTILFLTQFKWSSLLTCRDNECCSTGCHIRFGGEWVYLSGYQGENISPKFKPFCMWHEWFFSNYSWWAQEGFFFPNLHFQLVYRNLIANELCKLGCTYMVRTILFLTQFKWSSLLTCRDNECCSTGCHIRFGGEWVCLSGYQVRTFPLNSSLSVCDMNVVLFKLQLVCTV